MVYCVLNHFDILFHPRPNYVCGGKVRGKFLINHFNLRHPTRRETRKNLGSKETSADRVIRPFRSRVVGGGPRRKDHVPTNPSLVYRVESGIPFWDRLNL